MKSIRQRVSFMLRAPFFAADLSSAVKLFVFPIWQYIKKHIGKDPNANFFVRIREFGNECSVYLNDHSDLAVFREVFLEREYGLSLKEGLPYVIVDLGSNVGFSVARFALQFPKATIIACEPDPKTFEKLRRNTAGCKNVKVRNLAIASTDGKISFFSHPESSMSSSIIQRVSGQRPILVDAKSLNTLLKEEGVDIVDLLKFDIEGAEYEAFKGFQGLKNVKRLIGEVHPDLMTVSADDFLQLFNGFSISRTPLSGGRFIISATRG